MFIRFTAMFVILAIAVVTVTTTMHAGQMSAQPDQMVHFDTLMQVSENNAAACHGEQRCGAVHSECIFVCAGLSSVLAPPDGLLINDKGSAAFGRPAVAIHTGRTPDLTEHPPQTRLL